MSHLKDLVNRLIHVRPPAVTARQSQMEKVAERIARMKLSSNAAGPVTVEGWETIRDRMDFRNFTANRPRDIRRAIAELWRDEKCRVHAHWLISSSLSEERKTYDRELLQAYLRHFPAGHPAFKTLVSAAATAACRHDWPWRERGTRFRLWDAEEGPAFVGRALLTTEHPPEVLRQSGLDGDLVEGRFMARALYAACLQTGNASADEAERLGRQLVALFENMRLAGGHAMLTYGLLNPWRTANPSEAHRKGITRVLVSRVGDPRLNRAKWQAALAGAPGDKDALLATLRRWLTQATVREFFKVVGRVTNNPEQWRAREAFWLAYLEAGVIQDAWFAFGRQAEHLAHSFRDGGGGQFGEITGGGADPTHSALILAIGDIRIAEWSHNGSCRFWAARDRGAPGLYQKHYPGDQLRAMSGGTGFAKLRHAGAWQSNFAGLIFDYAGIRHPHWHEGNRAGGWR